MQLERKISIHRPSLRKQQGVAAVWMGLLLVPIMGVTFWAVEGTRYVQETSRLRDSAEAAAIAVTIEDKPDLARMLATQYVENYVRDIKSSNLSAQRFHQTRDEGAGILEYVQYTVNARTTHDSWFASRFIPSFDEQQTLAGRSLARKYSNYIGQNIDLVFVSDFSGSMTEKWKEGSVHKKIEDLKTAIETISSSILCTSTRQQYVDGEWKVVCDEVSDDTTGDKLLNRVGFVPYNIRTREFDGEHTAKLISQLSYSDIHKPNLSRYTFNDLDLDFWSRYTRPEVENCAKISKLCPAPQKDNQQYAKRVVDVVKRGWPITDCKRYVDIYTTVSTMFTDKSDLKSHFYTVPGSKLLKWHGYNTPLQFYDIPLTNDLSALNKVKSMSPGGGTSAYQGILKGFQVLNDGKPRSSDQEEQNTYANKLKMLLILSDGAESPNNGILNDLVAAGMCDKAREEIPGLYIGVIGIDFDTSKQVGFQNCVVDPDKDVIDVSNVDELNKKIEELIREGSKKTSGTTKLY
ncbi:pilus assembly protein TadG [Vibrio sp. 10N.286.51.C3]|uniref:TadE/TadG family type IV pilus assembly protein n=1 Tax=unclassified Vibrio TaxID=2614977 RepID=UPI000D3596B8|nr:MULTISPECIES: TadE/TadG family type IV pilus assembly protein [unclassified Vibrio]PTP17291.1 pilus assembly protein TadG [Vibrio sp. 10N.286.51.C3]TKE60974.1 pilus assembly protein [Vibrio sp. F12]